MAVSFLPRKGGIKTMRLLIVPAAMLIVTLLGTFPVSIRAIPVSNHGFLGWHEEIFYGTAIDKIYRGPNCEIARARSRAGYILYSIYKWDDGGFLNEGVVIFLKPNGKFKGFRRILYEITARGGVRSMPLDYDYPLFHYNCGDRVLFLPRELREALEEYHHLRNAVPPLVDKYGVPYI